MSRAKLYNDDGSPRYVRCYETKRNPTVDRFTVVFTKANCFMGKDCIGRVYYAGMSGSPYHPVFGFYQHGEAWRWEFCPHGSRIRFQDLPEGCRKAVLEEYADLWKGGETA
jgi:hypothetical protein